MGASDPVKLADVLVFQRLTSLPTNPLDGNDNVQPTGDQRSAFFIPEGGGALFYALVWLGSYLILTA